MSLGLEASKYHSGFKCSKPLQDPDAALGQFALGRGAHEIEKHQLRQPMRCDVLKYKVLGLLPFRML